MAGLKVRPFRRHPDWGERLSQVLEGMRRKSSEKGITEADIEQEVNRVRKKKRENP